MPAAERDELPRIPRHLTPANLSVRDLLASCAAATAVSTPPSPAGPAGRPAPKDDPVPAPPEAA